MKKSEEKPMGIMRAKRNNIHSMGELQKEKRKRKGHQVYLKQQCLKII